MTKDPFTHKYDSSGYVLLESAPRRDATTGRLKVVNEIEKRHIFTFESRFSERHGFERLTMKNREIARGFMEVLLETQKKG